MNRHEGVSCDSCLKNNFPGRRYKCLICYDYDLCANCYEAGTTTNSHTTEHPMQCILARSDFELYYGGEVITSEVPQSYICPFCNKMGFTDATLTEHVTAEHSDTSLEVVCPICASTPGGEPNLVTEDFAGHLTMEHRSGPRDLISFLVQDEPSVIRHGGRGRGVTRPRRAMPPFSSAASGGGGSGGVSALSPASREAVVDPIAELLSQLSGVRRPHQPTTPSQLQQLQMQLQLERQQVSAARQQLERLPRRGTASSSATAPAPAVAPPAPVPADSDDSQYLLSQYLVDTTSQTSAQARRALIRGLALASICGAPPPPPPPRPRPAPPPAPARAPPPRAKPEPRPAPAAAPPAPPRADRR